MCCGRLNRLTREKFRVPVPPAVKAVELALEVCPECGASIKRIASCCSVTIRCEKYPVCKYKQVVPKNKGKKAKR